MHPLMKHREEGKKIKNKKMRPTQPEMTTANQPVILKHVLKFCVLNAIENIAAIFGAFWHNVFYSSEGEETESCPPARLLSE